MSDRRVSLLPAVDVQARRSLPFPLRRWSNYADFRANGLSSFVNDIVSASQNRRGGFDRVRTDHLESELFTMRIRHSRSKTIVECYAALPNTSAIDSLARDLASHLPPPVRSTQDYWSLLIWQRDILSARFLG